MKQWSLSSWTLTAKIPVTKHHLQHWTLQGTNSKICELQTYENTHIQQQFSITNISMAR